VVFSSSRFLLSSGFVGIRENPFLWNLGGKHRGEVDGRREKTEIRVKKNGVGKIEEEKRKKKTIFTYARPEFGTICAALFAYCWENQNVGNLVGTESGIKKDALLLG
jgi:hypothetical protein